MQIQAALMKLLIQQPFYGALASTIAIRENHAIKRVEMVLMPSPVLKYNKDWYEALPEKQGNRSFVT